MFYLFPYFDINCPKFDLFFLSAVLVLPTVVFTVPTLVFTFPTGFDSCLLTPVKSLPES